MFKRKIFTNANDYSRFLVLLYSCNSYERVDIGDQLRQGLTLSEIFQMDRKETLVSIGAFCLMPNHFHLLIKERVDNGVSKFMQKLQTAYTMYFNKKNDRNGSLFQGTFKAKHVTKDEYLKYLFAYINLNPVKLIDPEWKENGIKNLHESEKYLSEYRYSSYLDLAGVSRVESKIIDVSEFPEYFSSKLDFGDFVKEWLKFKDANEDSADNNADKV